MTAAPTIAPVLPTFAFQWHITDECDQRCKHCYIFAEGACTKLNRMSLPDMRRTLDDIEAMCRELGRTPYIYLTGGDPILHPDFWSLAELLHERGHRWAIMGNPFHLTPEACGRMRALSCRKYQVSLDGLAATHDRFRKPGSFNSTIEAIRTIKASGMWCAVMSTVSSANMAEIPELIDLMAKLEVDVYAFGRYCPTSGQRAAEYHMEPLAYRDFLLECQRRILAHEAAGCRTTFQRKDHLWTLLEYEQGRFQIPAGARPGMVYGGCHCGIGHLTITPTGDVYACRRMESRVGNCLEQPLRDIFLGAKMEERRDFARFEKCAHCELAGFCRGCPAVAAGASGGNMYAADPQCWKQIDMDAPNPFAKSLRNGLRGGDSPSIAVPTHSKQSEKPQEVAA